MEPELVASIIVGGVVFGGVVGGFIVFVMYKAFRQAHYHKRDLDPERGRLRNLKKSIELAMLERARRQEWEESDNALAWAESMMGSAATGGASSQHQHSARRSRGRSGSFGSILHPPRRLPFAHFANGSHSALARTRLRRETSTESILDDWLREKPKRSRSADSYAPPPLRW